MSTYTLATIQHSQENGFEFLLSKPFRSGTYVTGAQKLAQHFISRASSFLARIAVPLDSEFDRFDLSLFFGILVTRSGNVAVDLLKLSYRIIEQPGTVNTITQAFPQNTLEQIPCDFSVTNSQYSSGYYTAESGKIRVKPGDLLLLKVERTPPDNFGDRIILLRKSAVLHYV